MLCWFRADTVARFRAGDVWFAATGALNVLVRHMKMRPQFRVQPGLVTIPGAPLGHWRGRCLAVLRRGFALCPGWECHLADRVRPSERGGSVAAALVSQQLRTLVPDSAIPDGCVVGSHSWREMMALAAYRSNRNWLRCSEFGLSRPDTSTGCYKYYRTGTACTGTALRYYCTVLLASTS
jgi:hypothetical protein